MKINGQTVVGKSFAYDGCHKIYLVENQAELEDAAATGYSIYPVSVLEEAYEDSCSLRFISNWKLDKQYVPQFEEAEFS